MSRRLSIIAVLIGSVTLGASTSTFTDSSTGALATPMDTPSAVALANGNALIFGDAAGSVPELYDASTGSFFPLAPSIVPGAGAAGVELNDGRVLIVGGLDGGQPSARAMVFDPAVGTLAMLDAQMMAARVNPIVTLLADGRVLVAGGYSDKLEVGAEIFDPRTNAFSATGAMASWQLGTATLLQSGQVLVAGGAVGVAAITGAAQVFDPATGTFTQVGAMATPRRAHQATLLADGRVLVTGGYDLAGHALDSAEVFDPATRLFSSAGSMNAPRGGHDAVALASGDVLIIGGRNAAGGVPGIETYAPGSGTFEVATNLLEPRWNAVAARLVDGRVLVAGGRGAAGTLVSAELVQGPPVTPVKATSTLTVVPLARQYSDRVTMTATVTPANAARSVTFKVGGQVVATAPVVAGTATVTPQLLVTGIGAKYVTAEFQSSGGYDVPSAVRPLTVLREDARVPASAPRTVNTGCSGCKSATVHLQSTVNDISQVDPVSDPDPGDIGMANVTFVNRASGATIATVPVIADAADHRTGTASYDWTVSLGNASSQTFTIGVVVGNQYVRNSSADDMKITVVRR